MNRQSRSDRFNYCLELGRGTNYGVHEPHAILFLKHVLRFFWIKLCKCSNIMHQILKRRKERKKEEKRAIQNLEIKFNLCLNKEQSIPHFKSSCSMTRYHELEEPSVEQIGTKNVVLQCSPQKKSRHNKVHWM